MCVSAEASFALTGVLVPVGAYCMNVARKRDESLLPLAAVPLLFGAQQFCEGLVWIGINQGNGNLTRTASLLYLFFAMCFWLFWMPFSAMFIEDRKAMRPVFAVVAFLGLAGGAMAYVSLLMRPGVLVTTVAHHSIQYNIARSPAFEAIPQSVWHFAYLAVVAFPLLVSSKKQVVGFNVALVLSAVVSHVFFLYSFHSVWCFFAAILSLYLAFLFFKAPGTWVASAQSLKASS